MPTTSKILEFTWSRLKSHYTELRPTSAWSKAYRRILGNYYRFLIPEGSSVLEIGCGSGELLQHLPNRTLAGIDLIEEQVNAAKQKLPHAQFACAAGESGMGKQPRLRFM